jgi:hypothetical protein
VTATNAGGSTSATSAATTVTIAAPVNTSVPTVSGATTTGSTLSCTTGSWTPAATGYAYAWTANGSPISGATGSTYVIVEAPGTQLRCAVTATNAGGSGSATSAALTVGASPPSNTALPTISGATTSGSTLTCANGTWTGSPSAWAYQWTANGTAIGGATSSTLVISQSVGTQLRCVVTATNAGGSTSATSAATTVTLAAPSNTALPNISGATTAGSTLTCSTGTWSPAPTSYGYAWTANGSPISGATSATYVITEAIGTLLRCTVTGTNATGSSSATSAAVTVSSPAAPANTALPAITGTTGPGGTLSCSTGTWTNAPTGYAYAWTAGGSPIAGETSSSHIVAEAVGTQLRCVVTATNAGGSASATSAAVTVSTTAPPTSTTAPAISGSSIVGSTISCATGTWTGSPTSFTYAWTANGSPIAGATASSLAITQAPGVQLRCVVTAANAGGTASATSSPLPVPPIPAPANTTPPTLLGSVGVGATLVCSPGTWTGSPTLAYSWSANGVTIPGEVGSSLVVTSAAGTQLRCIVTGTNGGGTLSATTAPATVTVSAPINLTAPSIGGSTTPGSTLGCAAGDWTGSPAFTYGWTVNGATIAETGATHVITAPAGSRIACVVIATNAGGSASASSAAITVDGGTTRTLLASRAPAVQTLAGRPAGAYVGGRVSCSPGTWESVEAPTYTFSWSIAGAAVPGAIGQQLTIPAGTAGRQLTCSVAATADGTTATASSPAVTIAAYNLIYGSKSLRVEDDVFGSSGNDKIMLQAGRDVGRGMAGDDLLYGDRGNDTLYGWIGRDMLSGGVGNDRLLGGSGNDRLLGGAGTDSLGGVGGTDTIVARDLAGTIDVVDCGPGRDTALVNRRDRVRGCEVVKRVR